MEPMPPPRLPAKDLQPLQSLSPERINGTRPMSTLSMSSKTSKTSDSESAFPARDSSPHSSPTRKANLFAEYHPVSPSKQSSVFGGGLPQSPSLPEMSALRSHVRTNSDVQGLVKRFEHLDVRDRDAESVERRKKHEAELRRAQIAREEAESDVKRLREEMRRLRKDTDESRERERKVGKRLEAVMEEYASAKEQYASKSAVYEKELRRSRKEAYKSSSAVIKLQEELKATRGSLRVMQSGFDLEKQKVERREQEKFNAQYQLAAVQEELDKLRAHLKIVEEEKEALKTTLKEDEVARIAAEGMIALPVSQEDDMDLLSSPAKRSPKKGCPSPLSDDKENIGVTPKKIIDNKRLQEELVREQMRREQAEEMVEFLGLECKFRCCSCQAATKRGEDHSLALSGDLASVLDRVMEGMKCVLTPPSEVELADSMQVEAELVVKMETLEVEHAVVVKMEDAELKTAAETVEEPEQNEEQDCSMTLTGDEPKPEQQNEVEEEVLQAPHATPAQLTAEQEQEMPATTTIPLQPSGPQTPIQPHHTASFHHQHSLRTITTTTTIPMHFTPLPKPSFIHAIEDAENIPPSTESDNNTSTEPAFDRAAALAAIKYRRGRAKSFAAGHLTPRKQMLEGINMKERRDISAPALGQKTVGGTSFAKAASSVGRSGGRRMG